MAQLVIKLEKKDINTKILGKNIMVECENNINIMLSREALDELFKDYKDIKEFENEK